MRAAKVPGTHRAGRAPAGLKVGTALLGVLLALLIGAIVFFTVGERTGLAAFAGIVALAFLLTALAPAPLLWAVLVAEIGVVAWAGWHIADEARGVLTALSTTAGPVAAADDASLAAAEERIGAANAETAFRLELHEDEVTAVLQEELRETDQPLRSIEVDIVDGPTPSTGTLAFTGRFKSGGYDASGRVAVEVSGGVIRVEVISLELGSINLPGFARGAVADYVDRLLDGIEEINTLLAEAEVDVQSITVGDDRLVITGLQRGGPIVTATSLLTDLAAQAAAVGPVTEPPLEVLGPGVVNDTFTEGSVYYLALGDSLAANAGAPSARDGYVSRVHNQLQERNGRQYGLLNLGVSGETSGSLIGGGQLDEAVEFLAANRVAYVTIDIGANDLLGHLTSTDCAESLDRPACRERLESALTSYQANISVILAALAEAGPEATIVVLETYNPFSLGTGIAFEEGAGLMVARLNSLAAAAAEAEGILVADGFTPMQGTAAFTTLMLASPPDIHPNALGHDVLAQAVMAALG
ncbi:MAG TPA: SGNH/GDSL hydrolase family protein [Acidimicrobiia bacterium]|nr:SGNH/GDSL hydrolase family protein [Acidimicrobiia bacterium]